ncbi:chromosome segregation protein SMC [Epidermidibacterium keratini]|uniref:Chromosome partition protein Smc n=1 Tax=Epidermidibacterium keratini TaxID=1891644 RepID=A0A7L4YRG4_9ACTN|nr:chromosome segregation protein SMC [Epidermidibacterium keratini]QHC01825.1 chromosome segregation protein SMC [Epidermidibacterium keratini]
MHLKSLTVKGFKSFASSTTLRLEPGVTCVVGPNGSGKSNVVDAISWVLGEQGAKALRGGKMEDVIFAGTSGRAPLGRAEVTLTIDNSDNALPIDYTEVSVTRRMYRSGESEYEINGDRCRLIDIQELMSDSGIGREMHVIVGQGQLDSVLQARPEDRRGFIEEAAGVLKHRKRKEKALRKLDAMMVNLNRVADLTDELRRQLKPLGKQADVARRAATIQADVRDSRLRLLADDLVTMTSTVEREVADETAMRERRTAVEAELAQATTRESEIDEALAADAPALNEAQQAFFRLSGLAERLRGTISLAAERHRNLSTPLEDPASARDPEELEKQAAAFGEELERLRAELETDRARLAELGNERGEAEVSLKAAEDRHVAAVRAIADRREGLAKLTGQVNTLRARASSSEEEIARLSASLTDAVARAESAQEKFEALQSSVDDLSDGEVDLDEKHESATAEHEQAAAKVAEVAAALQEAKQEVGTWTVRRDALAQGLKTKDGSKALLDAGDSLPGVLGALAGLITVEPGSEAAVAAALGALADATVVRRYDDAAQAIEHLKSGDAGQASVVVADARGDRAGWPALAGGARWALDAVRADDEYAGMLTAVLDRVAIVDDLDSAARLAAEHPGVRAVTVDGDVVGGGSARGGSQAAPSVIEVRAAVDEADAARAKAQGQVDELEKQLAEAKSVEDSRADQVAETLAALHESDARMSAVSEELAQLASAARNASSEADRLTKGQEHAQRARAEALSGLAELEERLRLAEEAPAEEEPSTQERDELLVVVGNLRQQEVDLRLGVRTSEERVEALTGRVRSLQRSAENERAAAARLAKQREQRARGAAVAADVQQAAEHVLARLQSSTERAERERDAIAASRVERETELKAVRARLRELGADLERLTDAVHRDEVARAEQRLRIDQLTERASEEFGITAEQLVGEYGPEVAVPPTAAAMAEAEAKGEPVPEPAPYDREIQRKRAAKAEKDLALLGKVNPLALEEFAALEERHQFLSDQLEDLKATRRDLLTVVQDVDARILEVFSSAYADVAREFEIVFKTLFPGGSGRLVLTDPDNLLTTGIEVEARPPGKKIKRLSLLSGGERSLTAVALLVAIFRARPSPFYVMDEVEAALDDVNLGRLITLFEQLRESSQLIIITHQKRTMEIADALYGVTMRGDGITQVISQRIREHAS